VITRRNWRSFARCGQEVRAGRADPRWWDFQPDIRDGETPETEDERKARHRKAMAVCRECPLAVKEFCLATAKPGVDEGVRVEMVLTPLTIGQPGNRKKLPHAV
jgi:hypothetical protein